MTEVLQKLSPKHSKLTAVWGEKKHSLEFKNDWKVSDTEGKAGDCGVLKINWRTLNENGNDQLYQMLPRDKDERWLLHFAIFSFEKSLEKSHSAPSPENMSIVLNTLS